MPKPLFVYDNWSAYDELSDNIPLTEDLAMRQLHEIVRLKAHGVQMDAYLMDAFWYDRAGGYLKWKPDRWPNGPDKWLEACKANGLRPGLWFPANVAFQLAPPDDWMDSLAPDGYGFSCFEGGFLEGYIERLGHWYGQGIRVFKFDFAEFGSATKESLRRLLPSEIRQRNETAFRDGLKRFKKKCPEAILCAYNGFEEAEFMTRTDVAARRVLNPAWMEAFDSIYVGDPRPADLPLPNFWRTLDVYADQMIWYLLQGGMEFGQLDNCAFMIGEAGTCYKRGNAGWKETLLLSLARGGRIHMTLGNLENLTDEDARWFAEAQRAYTGFSEPAMIGGEPGVGQTYGYLASNGEYQILTAVNPSLSRQMLETPAGLELAFSDRQMSDHGVLELGPGAMAVLTNFHLRLGEGGQPDTYLSPIATNWRTSAHGAETDFAMASDGDLHIVVTQHDSRGKAVRTSGGSPPNGETMAQLLKITVNSGHPCKVTRPDDKAIWSGLSWAYAVVPDLKQGEKIKVRFETTDPRVAGLKPQAFLAG